MSNIGRRGVLKALSWSPLAAKQMTAEAISTVSRVNSTGGTTSVNLPVPAVIPNLGPAMLATLNHIKLVGIPQWLEDRLRANAKQVYSLDPDIACKCWSMNVKVAHQRQRNYEQAIQKMTQDAYFNEGKSLIQKLLGFNWPWYH